MLLRHVINAYVGKEILKSSLPKVKMTMLWHNNLKKDSDYHVVQCD